MFICSLDVKRLQLIVSFSLLFFFTGPVWPASRRGRPPEGRRCDIFSIEKINIDRWQSLEGGLRQLDYGTNTRYTDGPEFAIIRRAGFGLLFRPSSSVDIKAMEELMLF